MNTKKYITLSCPVCGSAEHTLYKEKQAATTDDAETFRSSSDIHLTEALVKCNHCNLVFINPRPDAQHILDGYSNVVDETFIKQNELRIGTFKKSMQYLAKKCYLAASDCHILDIGCAGGAFPKAVSDLGYSVVGIEPSHWLCEQAKQRYQLDIRQGILADHTFQPEEFNLITLWDVIEHLSDPTSELELIHPILAPNGVLVVNFPNHNSVARYLLGSKWPMYLDVHLFYFTEQTMTKLLAKAGYQVVSIKPYWQTLELGYILQRAGNYFSIFNGLAKLLTRLNINKIPFKYNIGQSMVIAKKI